VTYRKTDKIGNNSLNISLANPGKKLSLSPIQDKTIHDFRSSLNVIIGYSELMLDGEMGKMTEEQRVSMKDILEKSRHLADMVNDLVLR
jgi:signal transduction histidine kinase